MSCTMIFCHCDEPADTRENNCGDTDCPGSRAHSPNQVHLVVPSDLKKQQAMLDMNIANLAGAVGKAREAGIDLH
jgi:hypothetical protein